MILYRYLPAGFALEAIQTKTLKVSRITRLNDPADCNPFLLNPRTKPESELSPDDAKKAKECLNARWSLISFSTKINDPVIWSHYSDSHKGIALGFDFTKSQWKPWEMKYPDSNERTRLDPNHVATLSLEGLEAIAKAFTTKAKSWEYESEYRVFLKVGHRLGKQENWGHMKMVGEHFFVGFPWSNLKEVVLGEKCSVPASDLRTILNSRDTPQAPKLRKASLSSSSFLLNIDDLPSAP